MKPLTSAQYDWLKRSLTTAACGDWCKEVIERSPELIVPQDALAEMVERGVVVPDPCPIRQGLSHLRATSLGRSAIMAYEFCRALETA